MRVANPDSFIEHLWHPSDTVDVEKHHPLQCRPLPFNGKVGSWNRCYIWSKNTLPEYWPRVRAVTLVIQSQPLNWIQDWALLLAPETCDLGRPVHAIASPQSLDEDSQWLTRWASALSDCSRSEHGSTSSNSTFLRRTYCSVLFSAPSYTMAELSAFFIYWDFILETILIIS